jgi:hypothetical protein
MQNLDKIIIAKEVLCRKNTQMEGLKLEERKAFVQKWYKEHGDQIVPRLMHAIYTLESVCYFCVMV